MKMNEIYEKPGRPVAYYPKLALVLDSIPAAIFLCQFVYWYEKGHANPVGWIYKTVEQIENETGLSYEQQKTARAKLKVQGLIAEHMNKRIGRKYYRVQIERLAEFWRLVEDHSEINDTPLRKSLLSLQQQQGQEKVVAKRRRK